MFIAVIEPGLIRLGCAAVAGQLRGQTVNVNRELLLYSRQHDTVQSMRYFHSRVVLPALYCQRIHIRVRGGELLFGEQSEQS